MVHRHFIHFHPGALAAVAAGGSYVVPCVPGDQPGTGRHPILRTIFLRIRLDIFLYFSDFFCFLVVLLPSRGATPLGRYREQSRQRPVMADLCECIHISQFTSVLRLRIVVWYPGALAAVAAGGSYVVPCVPGDQPGTCEIQSCVQFS